MQGLMPTGATRFDVVEAYYYIADRYHSGQWSKGYRKLSACVNMGYRPSPFEPARGSTVRLLAANLLRKRKADIRRNW